MEEASETQAEKPINATPFYCNICKIYCASPVNLQSHFLGSKHRLVEKALKDHGVVKPLINTTETVKKPEPLPNFVDPGPKKPPERPLEEQLNSCKDEEPALGLQYITEFQINECLMYECSLCDCQAGLTNMFMHVLGIKHKLAYLKKHRPELAEVTGRGSNLKKKIKDIAAKVEQEEGRKHIMVSSDLPVLKEDKYSVQLSDSLVTWFTEDDPSIENIIDDVKGIENKKDVAKSSEGGTQKAGDINNSTKTSDGIVPLERTTHHSTKCDDISKSKDEEKNKEELIGSYLFTNNEQIIHYLQTFQIGDEYDAAFILKVVQILTDSLVVYRQKVSETKDFSESNPEENVDESEPLQMTSETDDEPNTGFPEKSSEKQSSEVMETVNPQKKRKASPPSVNEKRKHFKHGVSASTLVDAPNEQASLGKISASDRKPSFPNMSDIPIGSIPGSSASKSHISKLLSSVRKNAGEVAATSPKPTALNPSLRGNEVKKTIKINIQNVTLKSKKNARTT
ncbi:uncharacterized protein [Anolis sagrei]|uniref:uncharacterized protein n=1 Tax=Anolis sagrei TaxID=38937 RepID=UPI0035212E56